jgi:glycosyltransferase involved in cell wall biosynthesis
VDGRLFTPERRSLALRRTWGVSEDEPVVIYVGRLAPEKNIDVAIAAYGSRAHRTRDQCHQPSDRSTAAVTDKGTS